MCRVYRKPRRTPFRLTAPKRGNNIRPIAKSAAMVCVYALDEVLRKISVSPMY